MISTIFPCRIRLRRDEFKTCTYQVTVKNMTQNVVDCQQCKRRAARVGIKPVTGAMMVDSGGIMCSVMLSILIYPSKPTFSSRTQEVKIKEMETSRQ